MRLFSDLRNKDDESESKQKLKLLSPHFRILCLHGKGGSGITFQKNLSLLENSLRSKFKDKKISIGFDYLTAPYPLNDVDIRDGYEWWGLPPGMRSFNADKYIGFEKSKNLVLEALEKNSYGAILGHSQGSILLSIMMTSEGWNFDDYFYILNGSAWPNPFSETLENFDYESHGKPEDNEIKTRALFVIGKNDKINPPEGAVRIRDLLKGKGVSVETCMHEGGHAFPVRDELSLENISNWLTEVINIEFKLSE